MSTVESASQRSTSPDHHSSDPAHTPDSTHSSILHDSDSDPDDLESISSPIPKPLLPPKPLSVHQEEDNEQERTSETRFSFSKDDDIRLVTSPLTKDTRSNSTSTPLPPVHLEEESEPSAEKMSDSAAVSSLVTKDEELVSVQSTKLPTSEGTLLSVHTGTTTASKPLSAHTQDTDKQNPRQESDEHPVTKVSTSSLTKDDESSKLRSVRSPLLQEDTPAAATTSYMCTNGGMVFAFKRPAICVLDGSMTENGRHTSAAVAMPSKTKAEKPKKKLSTSNPVDPSRSPHNLRVDGIDQSGENSHVGGRFSPRMIAKSLRFTSKEGGKKKKITLSSLGLRKKKLRENILPDKPVNLEQNASRKLSGSLECLMDAVNKDECPDVDPFAGEMMRSVSLFNVSVDLDENSEADPFSEVGIGRSISVTSDRSLRTESQASNESLQRLEEDCDSDDPPVVLRRLKRSSIHGYFDPQEHLMSHPVSDKLPESKKLVHRHSLKTIKEEKPSRFTRHLRNKSDTSMLPPFQPPSGSKSPSITSKHHQNSSFNLFQSLQEHLKSTISMPNVFRRERHSRPIVCELAPPEITTDTDPTTLLVQYQFLSLRCCVGVQSRSELRALLLSAPHNSEGQNYKLSFEREPN